MCGERRGSWLHHWYWHQRNQSLPAQESSKRQTKQSCRFDKATRITIHSLKKYSFGKWSPSGSFSSPYQTHYKSDGLTMKCQYLSSDYFFALMCPELKVGQYVTSQVEEVKNDGRVVRLSFSPATVAQPCAESQQGWNLTNLLPGLLVKATIKKVETDFIFVMSSILFF